MGPMVFVRWDTKIVQGRRAEWKGPLTHRGGGAFGPALPDQSWAALGADHDVESKPRCLRAPSSSESAKRALSRPCLCVSDLHSLSLLVRRVRFCHRIWRGAFASSPEILRELLQIPRERTTHWPRIRRSCARSNNRSGASRRISSSAGGIVNTFGSEFSA